MSGPSGLDAGHRGPLARRMLARTYEGRRDLLDGGGEPAGSVTQSRARSRPAGAATRPGGRQSAGSPRRPMTASPAPTPAGATRGAGRSWPAGHRRPAPGAAGAKTPAPRRVPGNLRHLEPPTMSPSRKARVTAWGGTGSRVRWRRLNQGELWLAVLDWHVGDTSPWAPGEVTISAMRERPDLGGLNRTTSPTCAGPSVQLTYLSAINGAATPRKRRQTTSETDLSPAAESLSIPTRTHSPRRRS
jgi:hypothetical protein